MVDKEHETPPPDPDPDDEDWAAWEQGLFERGDNILKENEPKIDGDESSTNK